MNTQAQHTSVPVPAGSGGRLAKWMMIAAGGVIVAGIIFAIASRRSDAVPRLNADTPTLATFVATDAYTSLPFQRQELFMKVLEERDDNGELKRAFTLGKISEAAYRSAIQEAWLGQQLKRSGKYAMLPAGSARLTYIAELLDRKQKPAATAAKPAGTSRPPETEDDVDLIKRDPTAAKLRMSTWPAQVREQVEAFRRDYETAREARDAAAKQKPVSTVEP